MYKTCVLVYGRDNVVEECAACLEECAAWPLQVFVGGTFYRSAWLGLRHGTANMSVLVVVGTTAAFAFSLISMVRVKFTPKRLAKEWVGFRAHCVCA